MQGVILMIVYIVCTVVVQTVGFAISRLVDYQWPTLGLMTFLIIFMAAFGIAWPLAVRTTEWLLRKAGREIETIQTSKT